MIPKHVHEAALNHAANLYGVWSRHPYPPALEAAISAYNEFIAKDAEVVDGVTLALRNQQLPGVKTMDEAKKMPAWFVIQEEARVALSYIYGAKP